MSDGTYRWLEIGLLLANAILLWAYVLSTRKIEKAASQQAATATRQAEISAQQAKLAADQVEGASRPVLTLHNRDSLLLQFKNIGNGPALNIKWWVWPEAEEGPGSLEAPAGRFGFIEPAQSAELPHPPRFLINPPRKVVCFYNSVGGVLYRTDAWSKQDTMVGHWYEHRFTAVGTKDRTDKQNGGNNA